MLNGLKTVGTFNTTTGETALTVDYPSPITMWFDDGATTSQLFISRRHWILQRPLT